MNRYGFPSTNGSSSSVSKTAIITSWCFGIKYTPFIELACASHALYVFVCACCFCVHSHLALHFIDRKCVSGSIKAVPKTKITSVTHFSITKCTPNELNIQRVLAHFYQLITTSFTKNNKNRIHKMLVVIKRPIVNNAFVLNDLILFRVCWRFPKLSTQTSQYKSRVLYLIFEKEIMIDNWIPIHWLYCVVCVYIPKYAAEKKERKKMKEVIQTIHIRFPIQWWNGINKCFVYGQIFECVTMRPYAPTEWEDYANGSGLFNGRFCTYRHRRRRHY